MERTHELDLPPPGVGLKVVVAPLVPMTLLGQPGGTRPAWPDSWSYEQASSALKADGLMVAHVYESDAAIDAWAARDMTGLVSVHDIPGNPSALRSAVRATKAQRGQAMNEWASARSEHAAAAIRARGGGSSGGGPVPNARMIVMLVAALGVTAAAWRLGVTLDDLLAWLGSMHLGAVIAADSFTAANGTEINNRTMPTGTGVWDTVGNTNGVCDIQSNAMSNLGAGWRQAWDDGSSAIGDQYAQTTILATLTAGGVAVRCTTGGCFWVTAESTQTRMFDTTSMSAFGTQIASVGTGWSLGSVARMEAVGTALESFDDAVSRLTATDSDHATGTGGVMTYIGQDYDDFSWGDFSGAGGADFPYAFYYGGLV